jgi:Ca2+-binding RTX toxin-like protein
MSREALEAAKRAKEFAKMLAAHGINNDGTNDVLKATNAVETFQGNAGFDTVSYFDSTSAVAVSLNNDGFQNRSFGGFAAGDLLLNIENVIGSNHSDYFFGDTGANRLVGLGGADTIYGGGGADHLYGDAGRDQLFGRGGNGTVFMDGGSEADMIKFTTNGGSANVVTGTGIDQVVVEVTDNRAFHVVIEDYETIFKTRPDTITYEDSLLGDNILMRINQSIDPGASIDELGAYHLEIGANNSDVIIVFDHPGVNGDITLKNFADHHDVRDESFFEIWVSYMPYTPSAIVPPV